MESFSNAALYPKAGTPVVLAVSGASAAFAADFAAGNYKLRGDIGVWYRINAAGVTTAAAVGTAPAVPLAAMDTDIIRLDAPSRVVAITTGGNGFLTATPFV